MIAAAAFDAFADIIFILDRRAANKNGHIAVLIGSEKSGWRYVSINGTGTGAKPWGVSVNQDIGTLIVDTDGNLVREMRQAVRAANTINPLERHHYDVFRRVECGEDEDFDAPAPAMCPPLRPARPTGCRAAGRSTRQSHTQTYINFFCKKVLYVKEFC